MQSKDNFEYQYIQLFHPKDWTKEKDVKRRSDELNVLEVLSNQGWEIKASSLRAMSGGDHREFIHLQRSSQHPQYGTRTVTDAALDVIRKPNPGE